jgi:DNA-binding CsgD family transcriptional regulator/tetratricopeptide (TPR) repeat protein
MAALTLGRGILESGDDGSPGGPLPVPSDLAGILRAQLARTSAEVLDVLLVVAVAADPSVALVEAVGGPGSRPAMERAIAEGVVIVEDGALRFTHALFGLVLEADADQDRLRRLHAQLAEVVQAPEERAMHLARSILDPDPAVASQLEEAARGVRARGAPSTAADLCERARLLTPADRPEDLVRRSLLESECRLEAGELPQSRALLEGLVESAPPGPARAAALQRLGWVRYHQDSWPSASDLFRRAAAEAESEPTLRASVELDRAVACQVSGDLLGAAAHAREAAERSVDLDDAAFAADAAAMVASVEFLLGRGIADDALERAVAAETWSRARPTAARPSVAYGVLLKWSDRFEASRSRLESALARTEEKGSERSLPFILFHLAEVECWMGDLDRAGSHAARASEVAAGSDQEGGRGFALAAQALVQAHRGQESEARDTATRGLDVATRTGAIPAAAMLSSVLGFLELSLGRPAAAHRHLGPLMASADSEGIAEPGAARYLGDGLEALIGVGELEVAERVTADLERRSEELDRAWGSLVAYRATGLVRAAEGDLGGARDALEVALLHAGRIAHPMELGRTLLVQGSIERRDRQKRSARLTLERSLEVFSGLGAELWIERCRSELSRIGGRQPAGLALSPTEERVARMAAEGATNQEIAAAQFLSVRTVEWHLSRVYRKLGLRSKVELARWFGANQHPAT